MKQMKGKIKLEKQCEVSEVKVKVSEVSSAAGEARSAVIYALV